MAKKDNSNKKGAFSGSKFFSEDFSRGNYAEDKGLSVCNIKPPTIPVPLEESDFDDPFFADDESTGSQGDNKTNTTASRFRKFTKFGRKNKESSESNDKESNDNNNNNNNNNELKEDMESLMDIEKLRTRKDKEGWLVKEGKIRRNWKKRWFVLQGDYLSYYTVNNRKHKGDISLDKASIRMLDDDPNGFYVDTHEGRSYAIVANNKEELNDWLFAIQRRIICLDYERIIHRHRGVELDKRMIAFLASPTLKTLDLTGSTSLFTTTVEGISEILKLHTDVETVIFKNTFLDDATLSTLAKGIAANNSIKTLDLSHNNITDVGLTNLANALRDQRSVCNIDLSFNHIGDDGISDLCDAISNTESVGLDRFNVSNNIFEDQGAEAIAQLILKEFVTISSLELSYNNIGDAGASALGESIGKNKNLKKIHLNHNKIGNDGIGNICTALKSNRLITEFDLSHNDLGYKAFQNIAAMLKENKTLEELSLGGNRIGDQALHLLANSGFDFPEFELARL